MSEQSPEPQLQSTFIAHLPREVRDKIYFELWNSCGLRQHIIWHRDKDNITKSHFCRWRCTTPFEVEDGLQEAIDAKRIERGVSLGESFSDRTTALQLFSAWKNHFACGERIAEVHGENASPGVSMLLSCKTISSECIKSIYQSTTFIFTDVIALNFFVGFCKVPELYKQESEVAISPPAFRTYGKHLELSLEPVFPMMLPCSSPPMTPLPAERHSLDFHGLRLDLLENLTTVNIWIAARSTVLLLDKNAENIDQSPYNVTQLSIESLHKALTPLEQVKNVTISMPLARVSEPEDGYVVDNTHLRIWRRGSGDRFHPSLLPVFEVDNFSSNVHSNRDRSVRLASNPETEYNVHYAQELDFSPVDRSSTGRGRVARFVDSIRAKGKWLRRDPKQ
ncbi:hypothetical protein FHETE_2234 [Fusarium heterosporum]|uniref:DUF7730 domain-containing protein n=1 Tax=Fusarium heterosporum TaxID=42747 RepID=A0A8H5TUX5_FUSHE|nr:hypothetical protein FHETE_2234 [Fusarium heterosporum]